MIKINLGDIKTRVKRQFGDESGVQVTDGDITRWVNDAQRSFIQEVDELLETIATANSVLDQATYSLPTNLAHLRSISYKLSSDLSYLSLKGMSLQQFDQFIDGWDGTFYGHSRPTVYTVYAGEFTLFPRPPESTVAAIKIYYSRKPTDLVDDSDTLDLPDEYFNPVVSYCLGQAYELDEDWTSASNKFQQMTSDLSNNRTNKIWNNRDYYPTITTLPEDNDNWYGVEW